mmetsp:Transcript_32582/g.85616  ORF Transcript_32582/g.85616 Transcript_32582/m.85616 type:complete len:207 (+) Transcript_32582:1023-1643(+)
MNRCAWSRRLLARATLSSSPTTASSTHAATTVMASLAWASCAPRSCGRQWCAFLERVPACGRRRRGMRTRLSSRPRMLSTHLATVPTAASATVIYCRVTGRSACAPSVPSACCMLRRVSSTRASLPVAVRFTPLAIPTLDSSASSASSVSSATKPDGTTLLWSICLSPSPFAAPRARWRRATTTPSYAWRAVPYTPLARTRKASWA